MTRRVGLPVFAFLPLLAVLHACSSRDAKLPADVTSAFENAFTRGDVEACTALFTEDAEIIVPNAPIVRGREAIEAFFKDQVAREIAFDTNTSWSLVQNDLGVEQGTYRVRNVRVGQYVEYGDYLTVWRHRNGRWNAYRTIYNVMTAPKGQVSVTDDEDHPASAPPP